MQKRQLFTVAVAIVGLVIIVVGVSTYVLLKNSNKAFLKNSVESQNNTAFTSIRDALSKSISLQCDVTDSQGRKTISYLKNGEVRVDTTDVDPKKSGSLIMKDKKLYMWNGDKGFILESNDDSNATGNNTSQSNQGSNILDNLEKYKQYCKPTFVSDSQFMLPAEVTFKDLSSIQNVQPANN